MLKSIPQLVTTLSLIAMALSADAQDDKAGIEFFEKNIRPVLVSKCYGCHSAKAEKLKAGLLLDTRDSTRRGGESGDAVVPGNVDDSLLIDAIKYDGIEMPPDEQLPAEVVANFVKWVEMGAPDPRAGKASLIQETIDFDKAREFWAFQPLQQQDPPAVHDANWAYNDIDRFVLARLEAAEVQPVDDASPEVLVRRIYFDLTGLPPTPEQLEEFLANPSREATRQLVDRLLDTPQFGERWGRHWLDVVRYGESTGMERNFTYPYAWRYRDYVIASFNSDKPFDQFITEQLAGDLLPADSVEQRNSQHVATGMLALGTKSLNERDREKFAMDIVDEQIDVTTRAFLGLTASCARCHDHKFDAIPNEEYYALAGIFRSTQVLYGTGGNRGNRQPGRLLALGKDGVTPVNVGNGNGKANNNKKKQANQLRQAKKRLAALKKQKPKNDAAKAKVEKSIARTQAQVKRLQKQVNENPAEDAKKSGKSENAVLAMVVLDANNPADTQVRIRGEANERGESVPRGFLTVATAGTPPSIDAGSGRLELARWITQEDNPLTARVAVNRVWQHLFGRGLVESVNNFGVNGDRPSHPELLDHLALSFMREGWSVKSVIREVVASRTYQLGLGSNVKAEQVDPENRLLWRRNQRRLEVESIRDAMLLASGKLDLEPGDKSVVTSIGDADIGRNIATGRFRVSSAKRSVYLPIVRGAVPEMLAVFDFPEPSIISGQRDVTTVPTQALYMMNSPFVIEQSNDLAQRLLADDDLDDTQRVSLAYRLAFTRLPTAHETELALAFVKDATESLGKVLDDSASVTAWAGFCQALFASAEFRYVN